MKKFLALSLSIVGILIFMSRINFVLRWSLDKESHSLIVVSVMIMENDTSSTKVLVNINRVISYWTCYRAKRNHLTNVIFQ